MLTRDMLVQQIDGFLERTGMAPSTFGRKAVNDGKLLDRLRSGGQVGLDTAEKIQRFILTHEAPSKGAGS